MLTKVSRVLPPDIEALMQRVIGCAIEVHRQLGAGFFETVYHKAMQIELSEQRIAWESERSILVKYKGRVLHGQRIDLVVERSVIVEVKAVSRLEPIHTSQLVSYLRATNLQAGRGPPDQLQHALAERRPPACRSLAANLRALR